MKLRPYQQQAIAEIRRAMRQGIRKPTLVLPTGAGKTATIISVIQKAVEAGSRVLVTAHRREIVEQFFVRLQSQAGIDAGLIMSGAPGNRDRMVQVAMRQTLANRKKPPANLVIIDEAHLIRGKQYEDLLKHYENAFMIFLTATPERLDGKPLGEFSDGIVNPIKMKDLIEQGYLCEHEIYSPREIELKKCRVTAGDYNKKDLHEAFDQAEVYEAIYEVYQNLCPHDRKVIGFCVDIEHTEQMAAFFRAKGLDALAIHSKRNDRDELIQRVRKGDFDVVFNPNVLTEGFDSPNLKVCLLCMATKSRVKYMQAIGRVMRPFNNQEATIIDFGGNIKRMGPPRFYDNEGFDLNPKEKEKSNLPPPLKSCPRCGVLLHPSTRRCPNEHMQYNFETHEHYDPPVPCEYEFPVKAEDGELATDLTWEKVDEYQEMIYRIKDMNYQDVVRVPPYMLRIVAYLKNYKSAWVIQTLISRGIIHGSPRNAKTYQAGWKYIAQEEQRHNVAPLLEAVKSKANGRNSELLNHLKV